MVGSQYNDLSRFRRIEAERLVKQGAGAIYESSARPLDPKVFKTASVNPAYTQPLQISFLATSGSGGKKFLGSQVIRSVISWRWYVVV